MHLLKWCPAACSSAHRSVVIQRFDMIIWNAASCFMIILKFHASGSKLFNLFKGYVMFGRASLWRALWARTWITPYGEVGVSVSSCTKLFDVRWVRIAFLFFRNLLALSHFQNLHFWVYQNFWTFLVFRSKSQRFLGQSSNVRKYYLLGNQSMLCLTCERWPRQSPNAWKQSTNVTHYLHLDDPHLFRLSNFGGFSTTVPFDVASNRLRSKQGFMSDCFYPKSIAVSRRGIIASLIELLLTAFPVRSPRHLRFLAEGSLPHSLITLTLLLTSRPFLVLPVRPTFPLSQNQEMQHPWEQSPFWI